MMKTERSVLCCVCLKTARAFVKISDCDSKRTLRLHKLAACVPEVEWNENWTVCVSCSDKLDVVYEFRMQCINSEAERKDKTLAADDEGIKPLKSRRSLKSRGNQTKSHKNEENSSTKNTDLCETGICSDINSLLNPLNTELLMRVGKNETEIIYNDQNKDCSKLTTSESERNDVQKLAEVRIKKRRSDQMYGYSCRLCATPFETSTQLLIHMQQDHKSDPKSQTPFACDKCESTFNSSSNLLQHKKYHTGNRAHICSYCGKGFITKGDLNVHEKHHLNRREYECDLCGKRFNTHKDIRSHKLVVHTDPKDWTHACGYCGKRFPIKSNLDLHTRRHTGDKPFACHLCEKRFVEKVVLQKHINSHSNVRAFKCSECNKEYKDKRILEIHLKKLHDIGDARVPVRVKKYFCSLCPKSYFAKNKLTRHMCSHTGVKPHCCEICQKKFTDKSYVKQHLKAVHNFTCND